MNLSFAGIISDVQHRVSKAGKGWAMFTIEDYGDSHRIQDFWGRVLENETLFSAQLLLICARYHSTRMDQQRGRKRGT